MQKLVWKNADGTELNLTSGSYGITNWEGFSNTDLNLQTQKVPFQDGSVYLDSLLSERELSVTLAINDENDLYKRYQLRRELIKALNPKNGEGYLIYTNDYTSKRIKCVAQLPIFPTKNSNDSGTPKASLSWTACNPYWEDLEETKVLLNNGESVSILNNGDIKSQIQCELILNSVQNPVLRNFRTGESIGLTGSYDKNIRINTEVGSKSVHTFPQKLEYKTFNYLLNNMCYCIDDDSYYFVGDSGLIIKTKNFDFFEAVETNINLATIRYIYYFPEKKLFFVSVLDSINKVYKLYYSTDAKNWVISFSQDSVWGNVFYNLLYAKGKFILRARAGIYTSVSGELGTWERSNEAYDFNDILYCEEQDKFYATTNNKIYVSSNLLNWSDIYTESDNNLKLKNIMYSKLKSKFVVLSQHGSYIYSVGGQSWQKKNIGIDTTLSFGCVAQLSTMFVLICGAGQLQSEFKSVYTSNDALNWTKQLDNIYSNGINYVDNTGVLLTWGINGFIWLSSNLKNYYDVSQNIKIEGVNSPSLSLTSLLWNTARQYFYGFVGSYLVKTQDFKNWNLLSNMAAFTVNPKLFYNKKLDEFVVINTFSALVGKSIDCINWDWNTNCNYPPRTDPLANTNNPLAYASNKNKQIIIGWTSESGIMRYPLYHFILVSNDNTNFDYTENITWLSESEDNTKVFKKIMFCEKLNLFVIIGYVQEFTYSSNVTVIRSLILTSSDGITWTEKETNTIQKLTDIIFDEQLGFLVCGDGGTLLKSEDGERWIKLDTGLNKDFQVIRKSENLQQYMLCTSTEYYTSIDCEVWSDAFFTYSSVIEDVIEIADRTLIVSSPAIVQDVVKKEDDNLISKLTQYSNMGFCLQKGQNQIMLSTFNGNMKGILSYRQKYIGV